MIAKSQTSEYLSLKNLVVEILLKKSIGEKVWRQKKYIKNIRLNVREQKKIRQMISTADSPTIKKTEKKILDRKPIIQKSDGENPT